MSAAQMCQTCEHTLHPDEVALNLKVVSRTARQFSCLDCLGKRLDCDRKALEELITYYRESGNCVLFR